MWNWIKNAVLGIEPTLDKAISGIRSVVAEVENVVNFHAARADAAAAEAKAQQAIADASSKAKAEAAAVAANFKKLLNG